LQGHFSSQVPFPPGPDKNRRRDWFFSDFLSLSLFEPLFPPVEVIPIVPRRVTLRLFPTPSPSPWRLPFFPGAASKEFRFQLAEMARSSVIVYEKRFRIWETFLAHFRNSLSEFASIRAAPSQWRLFFIRPAERAPILDGALSERLQYVSRAFFPPHYQDVSTFQGEVSLLRPPLLSASSTRPSELFYLRSAL